METIKLSPTSLGDFKNCPQCFWLDRTKGIKKPRGIFPSLPGGMDRRLKDYYDLYRPAGVLPPELRGRVPGHLFKDEALLKKWRQTRNAPLSWEDKKEGVILRGGIDDCVVVPVDEFGKAAADKLRAKGIPQVYAPLDYKTRGAKVKTHPAVYYQTQLEGYALMILTTGRTIGDKGYIASYYPTIVSEVPELAQQPELETADMLTRFECELYPIALNVDAVKELTLKAAHCLRNEIPASAIDCEYCGWRTNSSHMINSQLTAA